MRQQLRTLSRHFSIIWLVERTLTKLCGDLRSIIPTWEAGREVFDCSRGFGGVASSFFLLLGRRRLVYLPLTQMTLHFFAWSRDGHARIARSNPFPTSAIAYIFSFMLAGAGATAFDV